MSQSGAKGQTYQAQTRTKTQYKYSNQSDAKGAQIRPKLQANLTSGSTNQRKSKSPISAQIKAK